MSAHLATFDARFQAFTGKELIRRADAPLYQAKAGGRDTSRVFSSDETPRLHGAPPVPARQAG